MCTSYHSARAFNSIRQVLFVHTNSAAGIRFAVQQVIEQWNSCEEIVKVDMMFFACDLLTHFMTTLYSRPIGELTSWPYTLN